MFHANIQRRTRRTVRRGTVYIIVIGTAFIISVLGLSALIIQRVQRRMSQHVADVVEARLYADAGLRMGMLWMEQDPDWRYSFSNGDWATDIPIGNGTYTLQGTDPVDGDLVDAASDPLVLVGTGRKGTAQQKVQITLVPSYRGYGCLESTMHSNGDVKPTGATVHCDQKISANSDVIAVSSAIYSDVAAVDTVSGSTYYGNTDVGIDPLTLPDPNNVFDYYLAHGTWIDRNSLPVGFLNVLKNPGLESVVEPWRPSTDALANPTCTIALDTNQVHGGASSLKVSSRGSYDAGPIQDVVDIVQSGVTYECAVWVRMTTSDIRVHLALGVTSSVEGFQSWTSGEAKIKVADGWTQLASTFTPTFTGTVTVATLKIETKNGDTPNDFYIDDVVFKETGTQRTVYQKVLSPTSNPFGTTTNPQGIYLIDLANSTILIKNSRIVGTLVLIDPKTDSRIGHGGALNWEPAVPGFPALLVNNKDVTINPSNGGLVEYSNNANFNPPGTPYTGFGEDNDQDDTYPSEIKGLIYCNKRILFSGHPTVTGAVVSDANIEIGGELELTHNPTYLFNPPPGFNGPEEIRILLDSARKVPE